MLSALGVVFAAPSPPAGALTTTTGTTTYTFSGTAQYFTVPAYTTSLTLDLLGAGGANGGTGAVGAPGGNGGTGSSVSLGISVGGTGEPHAGNKLEVIVGGRGGSSQAPILAGGGGGAGDETGGGGGGGGGASGVYDVTGGFWIAVAGGGGGGGGGPGFSGDSGGGGNTNGAAGTSNSTTGSGGAAASSCSFPNLTFNMTGSGGGSAGTLTAGGGGGGGGGGCDPGNGGGAGGVGGKGGGGGSAGANFAAFGANKVQYSLGTGTGSVSITYTANVPTSPTFTSPASTTVLVTRPFTFGVTTTAFPPATVTETGPLPTGVTVVAALSSTSIYLKGTPQAGTSGTYPIDFTAHNTVGTLIQPFTLVVEQAPAITSGDAASFAPNTSGTFVVTSSGYPAPSLSEIGTLPKGLHFTTNGGGTATISGTPGPDTGGVYPIRIGAVNTAGSTTQTFTLTVGQAPAITSPATATFTVGTTGSFAVTATGYPAPSLSEIGTLPTGLHFTTNGGGTATISGTPGPGTGGVYPITLEAVSTTSPPAIEHVTLTVGQAPAITSPATAAFTVGTTGSFAVTATGYPAPSLSEIGTLPTGLHFTTNGGGTATISGTPTRVASEPVVVTVVATSSTGSAKAVLSITVSTGAHWMVAADGGVFAFGGAQFYGSMGGQHLNAPVVGMAATPTGGGYWLVASDGGVFAFGDAAYFGSLGDQLLNKPVVDMAVTPTGGGYWLVASDGGVFAFGDAQFRGSGITISLTVPVVALVAGAETFDAGYSIVTTAGNVFGFGATSMWGSLGGVRLAAPIVGAAAP